MSVHSTRLKEPSILLAATNCRRMIKNVGYVLEDSATRALEAEIDRNVVGLFELGASHLEFARTVDVSEWRQKISRLYYAAYNLRRSVALHYDGHFATDSSDHKKVGDLPADFPNGNMFEARLQALRDDRNMADYNHLAQPADLLEAPGDVESFVVDFRAAVRIYLSGRGLAI